MKEIIGNSAIISDIETIFQSRMPPVSIFLGPSVGKRNTALRLIKTRLCQSRPTSHSFCNKCYSCLLFNEEINDNFHPNCFYYDSTLNLDSLKTVISQSSMASINGSAKYIIIDDFNNLPDRLSNVLLKLLEEPPASLYFIIIAQGSILPTIMSRAQVFTFKDLSPDEMLKYLRDTPFAETEKEVLKFASVGFVAALDDYDFFSELQRIRQALSSKDSSLLVEIFVAQKGNFYLFLEGLVYYARERMLKSTKLSHSYRWSQILGDLTYTLTTCLNRTFNQSYILQTLALKCYLLLCRFDAICDDKKSILSLEELRLHNWLLE